MLWAKGRSGAFSRVLRRVLAARQLRDEHGNVTALEKFLCRLFSRLFLTRLLTDVFVVISLVVLQSDTVLLRDGQPSPQRVW